MVTVTTDEPSSPPLLRAAGIHKRFGIVEVLHGADLVVTPGQRHAVVGENGAGKSTLMNVICGSLRADTGSISFDGVTLRGGMHEAQAAGLAHVHQELSLVPTMTVAENCFLGRMPRRGVLVDRTSMRASTAAVLAEVGLLCGPDTVVDTLSFADRQLVEISKALLREPRLLVLDEPTSALSPAETGRLFEILDRLNTERHTAIVYISHRMAEIYSLCSVATVLRDGNVVDTFDLSTTEPRDLVNSMVGRSVDLLERVPRQPVRTDRSWSIEVDGLVGPGVNGVSLTVNAGEIVGLGGLVGSGRTELARLLVGLERPRRGSIRVDGDIVTTLTVRSAIDRGIVHVPEDRQIEGLALELTAGTNATVTSLRRESSWGVLRTKALRALAGRVLDEGGVTPPDPQVAAQSLSGGNQQKIVLGKWLPTNPRLLVLDEPTRGVDVNAKSEIHAKIAELADRGVAVLLISSEMIELLGLSDRIVVMREGRLAGEVRGDGMTEEAIIALASGQHDTHGHPDG